MEITGNIVLPLETLILKLESEGFKTGPDTCIRMQEVLKELGRDFFYKPRDLKQIICPLVARNRIEQEKFTRLFDEYFSEIWEKSRRRIDEIKEKETKKEEDKPPKRISKKWAYFLVGFLISVIIAIVLVIPSNNSNNDQKNGKDTSTQTMETGTQSNNKIGEFTTFVIIISISILLSIAYFLWFLITNAIREKIKNKKGTKPPYFLPFPDQNRAIELSPDFYHVANAMRQRREGDIQRLDIPTTISETTRSGGFPKLKFKQPSIPTEYLVDSLEREDIFIEKFFFQSDPRNCWNKNFPGGLTLQELHNKFPKHRLVIFGDAAYMVDSFECQLTIWGKSLFENWKERVLLTPVAVADWGYKEQLLNAELFVVLPADINGQLAIVESVSKPEKPGFRDLRKQFFNKNQISCQIDFEDISELKSYLDNDDLFDWICALSIYLNPTWEVTLAIGEKLGKSRGKDLITYGNLLKLTRIKWLQTGYLLPGISSELSNQLQEKPELTALAYQIISEILHKTIVPKNSFAYIEKELFFMKKFEKDKKLNEEEREVYIWFILFLLYQFALLFLLNIRHSFPIIYLLGIVFVPISITIFAKKISNIIFYIFKKQEKNKGTGQYRTVPKREQTKK